MYGGMGDGEGVGIYVFRVNGGAVISQLRMTKKSLGSIIL